MKKDHELEALKENARQIINSKGPYSQGNIESMRGVILSLTMNKIDFALAEALCEKFINSTDNTLQTIAITSIGHIARVYHCKVNSEIMKEIDRIYKDSTHPNWATVDDALDDISQFLNESKK